MFSCLSGERRFRAPPKRTWYESYVMISVWMLMGHMLPSLGNLFPPINHMLSPLITLFCHILWLALGFYCHICHMSYVDGFSLERSLDI